MDTGTITLLDGRTMGGQRLPRGRHGVRQLSMPSLEGTRRQASVGPDLQTQRCDRARTTGATDTRPVALHGAESGERRRRSARESPTLRGCDPEHVERRGVRGAPAPGRRERHAVHTNSLRLDVQGMEFPGCTQIEGRLDHDVHAGATRRAGCQQRRDGDARVGDRLPEDRVLDPLRDPRDPDPDPLQAHVDQLVRAHLSHPRGAGPQSCRALQSVGEPNQLREPGVIGARHEMDGQRPRPLHDANDGVEPPLEREGGGGKGSGSVEIVEAEHEPGRLSGAPQPHRSRAKAAPSPDHELFKGLHNPPGGRYDGRMASPLLLISLFVGCGSDPVEQDVATYQAALQPLLAQNLVVAQGFLDVASQIKKGETDAPQIAERLQKELGPLADSLSAAAGKIEPRTPALGEAHAVLVRAWTDRAASYHAMSDAWTANDLAGFENARRKNLQSKLDEEKFFQTVNGLTEPYGLRIDQYP